MFKYSTEVTSTITTVKDDEFAAIDFGKEVAGGTDDYYIRPTIGLTEAGEPIARYGIFNRTTGLLEAESAQLLTARAWCDKLTEALNRKSEEQRTLPGLDETASMH